MCGAAVHGLIQTIPSESQGYSCGVGILAVLAQHPAHDLLKVVKPEIPDWRPSPFREVLDELENLRPKPFKLSLGSPCAYMIPS